MRDGVRHMQMDDLAPLGELREKIAETQRELMILDQVGRELSLLVERGEAGVDRLVRRHIEEVGTRLGVALTRLQSICLLMAERGARLDA